MDYDPDYKSMGRYLRVSQELGAALTVAAEHGAAAAQTGAPVDTGDYAASIHVEDGPIVKPGNVAPRQSKRVVAGDDHVDYAIFVELRDHPLQSAIDSIERG